MCIRDRNNGDTVAGPDHQHLCIGTVGLGEPFRHNTKFPEKHLAEHVHGIWPGIFTVCNETFPPQHGNRISLGILGGNGAISDQVVVSLKHGSGENVLLGKSVLTENVGQNHVQFRCV